MQKSTKQEVRFRDVVAYRHALGIALCKEALRFSSPQPKTLEIGPGNGGVAKELLALAKMDETKLTLCEPARDSGVDKRFPKARVIFSRFEEALEQRVFPEQFDLIVANFSLHWVESISTFVNDLVTLLRPGGVLAMTNTDSSRSFWGGMDRKVTEKFPGSALFNIKESHSLSGDDWQKLFSNAGLEIKASFEYSGVASVFPTSEAAFNDFKNIVGSKYLRIAPPASASVIETYVQTLLKNQENAQGEFELSASAFQLVFRK